MIKDIIIVLLVGILITGWLVSLEEETRSVRVYDCGMADWHPDIPNSVKEECRKRRFEEWKKNNSRESI